MEVQAVALFFSMHAKQVLIVARTTALTLTSIFTVDEDAGYGQIRRTRKI
jgi:hypothetical protein